MSWNVSDVWVKWEDLQPQSLCRKPLERISRQGATSLVNMDFVDLDPRFLREELPVLQLAKQTAEANAGVKLDVVAYDFVKGLNGFCWDWYRLQLVTKQTARSWKFVGFGSCSFHGMTWSCYKRSKTLQENCCLKSAVLTLSIPESSSRIWVFSTKPV